MEIPSRMDDNCRHHDSENGEGKPLVTLGSSSLHSTSGIYLDFNATTPLAPEVLSAITHALEHAWGNPSSSHAAGKAAKEVITLARQNVGLMLGAREEDIIFTSGGTEANNMVLLSALEHFNMSRPATLHDRLPHLISSNLEHDSVKLYLEHLVESGQAEVTFVAASHSSGQVMPGDVLAAVQPNTCLVSIMMANNETGILQPIQEISCGVRSLKRNPSTDVPRILLHTDAAQSIGKVPVSVAHLDVDFLTVVGHKFYGPRIGALYVKGPGTETPLHPMFYGGGQERKFRPGTENTGMIAGLGKAAELVHRNLAQYEEHMRNMRDVLEARLKDAFGDQVYFNGRRPGVPRLPNTSNFSILGGEQFSGRRVLAQAPCLQASVGAACHSEAPASAVLLASGVPLDVARNAVRLSVGRETSRACICRAVEYLQQAVHHLRATSAAAASAAQ